MKYGTKVWIRRDGRSLQAGTVRSDCGKKYYVLTASFALVECEGRRATSPGWYGAEVVERGVQE